jgi:hypothetical protein
MGEQRQIRGVVGQITWSYYVAAAIHGYTVTQSKQTGAGTLHATMVSHDAFRLAQRPLTFVAPHASGAFKWTLTDLTHDPVTGTVRATLSPFQEKV